MEQSDPAALALTIATTVRRMAAEASGETDYREPLVAVADAADPRFAELRYILHPGHALPAELLPGAHSVVAFFLPFTADVVAANARDVAAVHRSWAIAYVETNALIGHITAALIKALAAVGVRAAAQPATHNFDPVSLHSSWSHKSAAVIAGLGSFGLHQMVITEAGCAGRFGSLVVGESLPAGVVGLDAIVPPTPRERCLYFANGSCMDCVAACPARAIDAGEGVNKEVCHNYLHASARRFAEIGLADVCGKCAVAGPCAMKDSTSI